MSVLNLRSEDQVSEPSDEIVRDETPPGLEAIRAWLGKPRPWLRGIRLWVRYFGKGLKKAWKWTAANAPAAAERTAKLASRGAEVARHVARTGTTAAQVGRRLADVGRDWRNAGGRAGKVGAGLASAAGRLRDFSSRIARTASHGVAIGEGISDLGSVLGDLRQRDPAPAEEPVASEPVRRLVPPRPEKPRRPLPEPRPDPETPADPEGPEASPPPRAQPSETASAAPAPPRAAESGRRTAALAELPWYLQADIRALSKKPTEEGLRVLIVSVLRVRGWTTSKELALILDFDGRNLKRRHLGPLVDAGVLELRYPNRATHPRQAYRVTGAESPPPDGTDENAAM